MVDVIKCPYYKNINNTLSLDDYITHKTFYRRDRHLLTDSLGLPESSKDDLFSSNVYFTKNNNNFFYKKMNLENICDGTLRINSGNQDLESCNKNSELVFGSISQIKNKSPHTFPKSNNDCSSKNITQNKIIKLSKYSRSLSYN
jgi:hypothetical protein